MTKKIRLKNNIMVNSNQKYKFNIHSFVQCMQILRSEEHRICSLKSSMFSSNIGFYLIIHSRKINWVNYFNMQYVNCIQNLSLSFKNINTYQLYKYKTIKIVKKIWKSMKVRSLKSNAWNFTPNLATCSDRSSIIWKH